MIEENEDERHQKLILVDEFPNPLTLSRESENDYFNGIITLTNKTSNYVIFKVYFSSKSIFSASPSMHFIQPLSSITITVKYLEKTLVKGGKPIKMLIAVHQMEKVINSKEEVKELFKQKKEGKTVNQEITVQIVLSSTLRTIDHSLNDNNGIIGKEDINCDDLPLDLGIEKMKKINENYKAVIDSKQKAIFILECKLENLGRNKQLFQSKEKALTKTETDKDQSTNTISQNIFLMLLLFSLILGGFCARVSKRLF